MIVNNKGVGGRVD